MTAEPVKIGEVWERLDPAVSDPDDLNGRRLTVELAGVEWVWARDEHGFLRRMKIEGLRERYRRAPCG